MVANIRISIPKAATRSYTSNILQTGIDNYLSLHSRLRARFRSLEMRLWRSKDVRSKLQILGAYLESQGAQHIGQISPK